MIRPTAGLISPVFWVTVVTASYVGAIAPAEEMPSPSEVYRRYIEMAKVPYETAQGVYLYRTYSIDMSMKTKGEEHLKQVEVNLRKAAQSEMATLKQVGAPVDPEKFEQRIQSTLAEMREDQAERTSPTVTILEKAYQSRDRLRTESLRVADDVPLEEIRRQVVEGKLTFDQAQVTTWDGIETNQIIRDKERRNSASGPEVHTWSDVRKESLLKVSPFFSLGREVGQENFDLIGSLAKSNQLFEVRKLTTAKGEKALQLFTDNKSSGFEMSIVFLPDKAYALESTVMKGRGLVISQDNSTDFITTSIGFWFPLKSVREHYGIEANKSVLVRRTEFLAVNEPKFNEPIPDELFSLRKDPVFTSSVHLDRQPRKELGSTAAPQPIVWAVMAVNVLIVAIIFVVIKMRRRNAAGIP